MTSSSTRPIGVVGAGNMGSGIAQKIATEGLPVVMVDMSQEAADKGMERIRTLLGEGVQRKIFTPEQVEAILGRVTATADFGACANCDIVIEAVFESLEVKREVFGKLDAACGPDTILATNTSSFYVDDVAQATKRPDRVVGLHYFYHPAKNRLVEVIPGKQTSEETRQRAWVLNEVIGKTPIHSADAPGFVVNRYFVPWLNESGRMLDDGEANVATIEAAAKKAFRIGMGPFELMNVTGVPITLHAATTLGNQLGPFYAPSPRIAAQVESKENWDLSGEVDESKIDRVANRLLSVVFQVACQMVQDGVCSIEDADIGARVGLRWSLGPFELMNRIGVERAREMVEVFCSFYEDLSVPPLLANQKGPFEFELVKVAVNDGLAEITLNRPDAMNALNGALVAQLEQAFDKVDARDDVRTIVLRGAGKAFVAGADIKFFVKSIEMDDFDGIYNFTARGQALFRRIDESKKLVIVRLDGLSLGGGSELALCADTIVATEKGSMGFPETGIGIYPGLGGTQRTTRRVGVGLARYLVLTGDGVNASRAHAMGLVDEVVPADRIGARILEIHRTGQRPARSKVALDPRTKAVQDFFETADIDALLANSTGADEALAKVAKKVSFKAPVACRLADEMIHLGAEKGHDAGLDLELASLKKIFATKDAYEGLTALGRRRPAFKGE